jgi:hypothetical protein
MTNIPTAQLKMMAQAQSAELRNEIAHPTAREKYAAAKDQYEADMAIPFPFFWKKIAWEALTK